MYSRLETPRRFSLFIYYLELLKLTNRQKKYNKIIPKFVHRNISGVPSSLSINRVFVFVDYANKLSPTLKSSMFASARSDYPDVLFEILIEEGQRIISMLILTPYRAYQDAF